MGTVTTDGQNIPVMRTEVCAYKGEELDDLQQALNTIPPDQPLCYPWGLQHAPKWDPGESWRTLGVVYKAHMDMECLMMLEESY